MDTFKRGGGTQGPLEQCREVGRRNMEVPLTGAAGPPGPGRRARSAKPISQSVITSTAHQRNLLRTVHSQHALDSTGRSHSLPIVREPLAQ